MRVLENYEPKRVLYYFEEIAGIPHGSGNLKQISDYLVSVADKLGLPCRQDDTLTVTITKPGSKGRENEEPVILQGHMDMVAVRAHGSTKDMTKEGLELMVDGDLLSAKDTTLGADDGIAVAYGLALLEADDLSHPPLEVIFTTDEETGMYGAIGYDASELKGHRMINLDSEEEGVFIVSCAGGTGVIASFEEEREAMDGTEIEIECSRFQGGHSGQEINEDRFSASICLARILMNIGKQVKYHIIYIHGGKKDNAIPTEAVARIMVAPEEAETAVKIADEVFAAIKEEAKISEPNCIMQIAVKEEAREAVFGSDFSAKVITALNVIPVGMIRMNPEIDGMVQSSLNCGKVRTKDNCIVLNYSLRSSVESEMRNLFDRVTGCIELAGGVWETEGIYPGWAYRSDSPLREKMIEAYRTVNGKDPEVLGLHAGLECGVFSSKIEDLDVVSCGPQMWDIHTENERTSISSIERTWNFLLKTLEII